MGIPASLSGSLSSTIIISGLLLSLGGVIVYQLRQIPTMIYRKVRQRLIYTVRIYQYDDLFDIFEKWLGDHYQKAYRDVEASIVETLKSTKAAIPSSYYPDDNEKELSIQYKQEDNTFILKFKGKKLLINKNKEKLDKATDLKNVYFRKYNISGLRAKKAIDGLLRAAITYSESLKQENTIKVYSSTSYGDWYTGAEVKVKPITKTILEKETKDIIVSDVNQFLESEEWYLNTSIPYKRGYCFYGPPGTGKTTLSLALANFTHRNIYCLNLNAIEDDSKLPKFFSGIDGNSILLLEDIDKVFSGRDNVNDKSKVTFSSLLNCLDGAFYKHGLITIITTNHLEKLDPALLRTGRMDIKVEIPRPADKEISEYLTVFYNQKTEVSGEFDLTMSDVQEICLRNKTNPLAAINDIYSKTEQKQAV